MKPGDPAPPFSNYKRRADWEADALKCAVGYTLNMWRGPGRWERFRASSLEDARDRALELRDEYGRRPLLYAVLANGMAIHVSDKND